MRLVTFNINGLRRAIKNRGSLKALLESLDAGAPPAVCALCLHDECVLIELRGLGEGSVARGAAEQCADVLTLPPTPPHPPAKQPDIVCFQETKIKHGDLEREDALVEGW